MALGKNGEVIWCMQESRALTSPEQLGAVTSLQIDLELNGLVPAWVRQVLFCLVFFSEAASPGGTVLVRFLLYVKNSGIFLKTQAVNIVFNRFLPTYVVIRCPLQTTVFGGCKIFPPSITRRKGT